MPATLIAVWAERRFLSKHSKLEALAAEFVGNNGYFDATN